MGESLKDECNMKNKKDKDPQKNLNPRSNKNKFIVLGIVVIIIAAIIYLMNANNTVDTSVSSIDGIPCETQEYSTFHVHAHLDVFVNDQHVGVPALIGIQNTCLYWLHTHTPDGVIHIESPKERDFTIGEFLDIWKSKGQALPTENPEIFINGNLISTKLNDTVMNAHDEIVLAYGNVPQNVPAFYNFPQGE